MTATREDLGGRVVSCCPVRIFKQGGGSAKSDLADRSIGFPWSGGSSFPGVTRMSRHNKQEISSTLAHKLTEFVFVKIRLEQVRPDSAFWSSEMSTAVTCKPRASMRARVRGNDAGKMMVPASASALAACGSPGSTSIHSWPASAVGSNQ